MAVGIAAYARYAVGPEPSLTALFLVGAGLQLAVICARRFVPPDRLALTMYYLEMIADGATILLYALGVFGGIQQMAVEV